MFAASKTASSGGPPDAQFNYVTMLLHGDGTNGAQNNTFLDSSTNNFTITRNGNTTQGTFSPYGANWSNYFDGSSYLSVANNTALQLTGDFTIEGWFYISANTSQNHVVLSKWNASSQGYLIYYQPGTNGSFGFQNTAVSFVTSTTYPIGQFYHVAVTRSGNNYVLYVNGTSAGTATSATTATDSGTVLEIGRNNQNSSNNLLGYASNVRIVKGTVVYTGNFTPSTTPLTAITNTQLLTCQSNRFIDNSGNAFTLTAGGSTSVQRFNPFGTATAYSTSVIGGSGYFDGAGDYLVTSGTGSFNPRSTFTIEFWTYPISSITQIEFISSNTNNLFYFETFNNDLYIGDGSINTIGTTPPQLNRWTHVLLSFDGTTYRLFYNGVSQATSTSLLASNTITAFRIAQKNSGSYPFTGYMGDMRVLVGTALYTSAFTPPTTPLTAITNTTLLLNYTNGAIFDNAMMNDLETVGNAQISTSVKKYGTGSLAFDGTGDYLVTPATPSNRINTTGNFTIEFWAYFNSVASDQRLIAWDNNTNNFVIAIYMSSSGNLAYYLSSNGTSWNEAQNVSMGSVSTNTWYHIALVRNGSVYTPYINGVAGTTTTNSVTLYSSTLPFVIGAAGNGASTFNGYIDEFRITKGYARYTSTFTPPTAAFPNIGPV